MTQQNQACLFPDGAALRDEAIRRAGANADDGWMELALAAIVRICRERREFTTDHLWELVSKPREPRAAGAAMKQARRAGLCVPTDRTVCSARPECHVRPVRVWQSLAAGDLGGDSC